jgi:hypothetical protein
MELVAELAAAKAVERAREIVKEEIAAHVATCPMPLKQQIASWKLVAWMSGSAVGGGTIVEGFNKLFGG